MSNSLKMLTALLFIFLFSKNTKGEETFFLIGKVDFGRHQLVTSSVDGVLTKMHVRSGAKLNKGQLLIDIDPFDPSFSKQQVFNEKSDLILSEALVREGEKVEKHQPVLRLNNKQDMLIRAISYYPANQELSIGQSIEVVFDADSDRFQLPGRVIALHNHTVGHNKMFTVETEVSIDNQACFQDAVCSKHYRVGNFVKLQFTRP